MQTEKKIKKQKKTLLLLKALFMPMVLRRAELHFTSCVCFLFPPPVCSPPLPLFCFFFVAQRYVGNDIPQATKTQRER